MKVAIILMLIATVILGILVITSTTTTEGNSITSSTTKHSYDNNALQPQFGDGTGMKIVTISGLD